MHAVISRDGPAGLTSRNSTHITAMLTRTGRTIWKRKPRRSRRAMIQRLRSISRRSPLRLSHFRFVTSTTRSSSDSDSSFPSSFSSLPRSTSASGSYAGLTSASSTSSLELVDPLPSPMVLYRLSLRAGMHPIVTAASPRDTSFVASSVSSSSRRAVVLGEPEENFLERRHGHAVPPQTHGYLRVVSHAE